MQQVAPRIQFHFRMISNISSAKLDMLSEDYVHVHASLRSRRVKNIARTRTSESHVREKIMPAREAHLNGFPPPIHQIVCVKEICM